MIAYRLPAETRAVLFDVDGTLYTNGEYGRYQVEAMVRELARARGVGFEAMSAAIERTRAEIEERDGIKTSLGNAMAAHGVDIPTSVAWRERLIDPSRFLRPDARLREALLALRNMGLALAVVTNNPRSVGLATLRALGVEDLFQAAVGLDDTMVSKPAREPFLLAARLLGVAAAACLSVGDRYDVDLAVPLELGMGAVLVDGVEDAYGLPGLLSPEPRPGAPDGTAL